MNRRIQPHTAQEYEQMIVETARQEGFGVENVDGTIFLVFSTWSPCGEEVVAKVNVTRFANTMARTLS